MSALLQENPEYQAVTIITVHWDTGARKEIGRQLGVRRQSTLVMFRDGQEIDRIAWNSSKSAIEPLFKAAIQ